MKPWLIWLTRSRGEWETYRNLLNAGIEAYYPFTLEDSRRERHKHPRDRPLFPGYVFGRVSASGIEALVDRIPGSRAVLRSQREIVQLTDKQFRDIKRRCLEIVEELRPMVTEARDLAVGDLVTIPHGLFAGVPAIIGAIDNHGVVSAHVGQFTATFPASAVISAAPQSVAVSRVRLSNDHA